MGVLSMRIQGSITAITAMATASVWSEFPDKSALQSFSNLTGQTLLLSSMYAPVAASTFDVDFSLMSPPVTTSDMTSISSGSTLALTSASLSPSIRHYKARAPIPVKCDLNSSHIVKLNPFKYPHPSHIFEISKRHKNMSNSLEAHKNMDNPFTHACAMSPRVHSCMNAFHPSKNPSSMSSILQAFRLENIFGSNQCPSPPMASSSLLHTWHRPLIGPNKSDSSGQQKSSSSTTVVLLGWLGAEHRHLKKYVDWYTSRGMHAVTFIVPMKDLLTLDAVDKAEKHVDVLTGNLVNWIKEDVKQGSDKHLIFHTFSNTGWLAYGAVLERLMTHGDDFLEKIKGCVVDSAPSAKPNPQVWASGFSAALLKKSSVATQKLQNNIDGLNTIAKPSMTETALLTMLEKFFSVLFQVPHVNRRLTDVVTVLSSQQPACPQLYVYSSADAVIPATSVEAFIEEQKKAGRMVKACNFETSPHVDHFRSHPEKYSEQLTCFLKVCMPQWVH